METFSLEFVEPRVRCVSSHGAFSPSRYGAGGAEWQEGLSGLWAHGQAGTQPHAPPSASCLPSRFPKPPQPTILRDCLVLPLPPGLPLTRSQELTPGAPPSGPQPRPPTAVDPDAEPTLLRHPQVRTGVGEAGCAGEPQCPHTCPLTEPVPAGDGGLHHPRACPGPLRLPAARLPARPPRLRRGGPRERGPHLAG